MLQAGFRRSRLRGAGFPVLHVSLSLWNLSLLCFAALGAGQIALAQQKTAADPSKAGPAEADLATTPAAGAFNAAGMGTGSRTIDGLWQFQLSDDPAWAQPGFDDSKWERLPADRPLSKALHRAFTGFAWYRRQITLDPADKNPLSLYLPPLWDAAEVYWDGVKVGGFGSPPPHPTYYMSESPVAIPLPSAPGASSGELAIRLWRRPNNVQASEFGGFDEAPRLGYTPIIQQMQENAVLGILRDQAVTYGVWIVFISVGFAAIILWLRRPSQWTLFCVGIYLLSEPLLGFCLSDPSLSYTFTQSAVYVANLSTDTSFLFLILLLADLPNRPGVRGFRFWKKACFIAAAVMLLGTVVDAWLLLPADRPNPALSRFLDKPDAILSDSNVLFLPMILIVCLVLGKWRLPRLLFMAAASLDLFFGDLMNFLNGGFPALFNWLASFYFAPLFSIHGSPLAVPFALKFVLLATIIYAVWDQLSRELAQQRRVNAELKAAQEVQTILVAAEERRAPGYAVASVYRPASEVGGDFFQVIPLEGDGTLIVAGDVSGKGLRAAMAVSLIVGAVRTLVEQDASPAGVLAGLNRRLIGRTQGGFATCCAVRIDPTGHATMANAGHCQPYLDDREVELPPGLPLGLVEGMTYDEIALAIAPGQQITLVSDGVVEARNHHGELYGFERLSRLMGERPSAEHVANTAIEFGQDDDITVLTVTRLAAKPEAATQLSGLSPAPA
jgi:hypothetical protein